RGFSDPATKTRCGRRFYRRTGKDAPLIPSASARREGRNEPFTSQRPLQSMTMTFYGAQGAAPSSAVFDRVLRRLSSNWTWGRLTLVLPDGSSRQLSGKEPGHAAVMM